MSDTVHRLTPAWNLDGNYPYRYVDSRDGTFEIEEFDKTEPLANEWTEPALQVIQDGEMSDVCYCATGYFLFNERARDHLAELVGSHAEWLPAKVDERRLWIPHPLVSVALSGEAEVDCSAIGGNITAINRYAFARPPEDLPPVFFIANPPDSAAGKAGHATQGIYVTSSIATVLAERSITGIRAIQVPL